MTDRELLEMAARAAGMEKGIDWVDGTGGEMLVLPSIKGATGYRKPWNPLTDDGDAFRLAVKLGLGVIQWGESASATHAITNREFSELHESDPYAATRRAIVRAAAEIGSKHE